MKDTVCYRKILFLSSAVLVLVAFVFEVYKASSSCECVGRLYVEPGNSVIYIDDYDLECHGFDRDGVTFFFLPSFVNITAIDQNGSGDKILLDDGRELTMPHVGSVQDISVKTGDEDAIPWKIGIFNSENLYTIFVSLDGLDYPEISHDEYSMASVEVYSPNGKETLAEYGIKIKGRGNGSWNNVPIDGKRSYQLKFNEKHSICEMKESDKWALISNAGDYTKIKNKLIFDMAAAIDMEYAIESDWIDLYINNEYAGNYLLCHEPDIGMSDLNIQNLNPYNNKFYKTETPQIETDDIKGFAYNVPYIPSGGYLVEKQYLDYYYNKKSGFLINGIPFSIKSPSRPSVQEVEYLASYIRNIDEEIRGKSSGRLDSIDKDSFVRRCLLEEMSLNADMAMTSYYFYKKPNDNKLYAGPNWDYDGSFGAWPSFRNYSASMNDVFETRVSLDDREGYTPLDWDLLLLEDEEYYEYLRETLEKYMPIFDSFLSKQLDVYFDKISSSLKMDSYRWHGNVDWYQTVVAEYKYLKFFFYKRLQSLSKLYHISYNLIEPDIIDGSLHKVTLIYSDGINRNILVLDGTQISKDEITYGNKTNNNGWRILDDEGEHAFSFYKPIFCDITLVQEK